MAFQTSNQSDSRKFAEPSWANHDFTLVREDDPKEIQPEYEYIARCKVFRLWDPDSLKEYEDTLSHIANDQLRFEEKMQWMPEENNYVIFLKWFDIQRVLNDRAKQLYGGREPDASRAVPTTITDMVRAAHNEDVATTPLNLSTGE